MAIRTLTRFNWNLTVVIFTHNRQKYIERQISYWQEREIFLKIYDDSDYCLETSKLKTFPSWVQYEFGGSLSNRLYKASENITSDFVCISGDDDFLLPSGIFECINELDKNQDLVCVIGEALSFTKFSNVLYFQKSMLENKGFENLSDNLRTRIERKMLPYQSTSWYGVHRNLNFCRILRTRVNFGDDPNERPLHPRGLAEITLELSTALQGKSKCIPVISWVRSYEEEQIKVTNDNFKIREWFKSPRYEVDRKVWMTNIIKALNLKHDISYWSDLLKFGIECYIKSEENKLQFNKNHKKIEHPSRFKNIIKFIVQSRRPLFLSLIELVRFILKRNSIKPVYIRSINHIFGIKHILNYYSQKELKNELMIICQLVTKIENLKVI